MPAILNESFLFSLLYVKYKLECTTMILENNYMLLYCALSEWDKLGKSYSVMSSDVWLVKKSKGLFDNIIASEWLPY